MGLILMTNQSIILYLGLILCGRATVCLESGEGRSLETEYDIKLQLVSGNSFRSRVGVEVVWGIIAR